ncbi:MAG: hypothetical protein M1821_003254 [Bathelium mastoideum]|nr:MAG: hypothetical protein M1821_003254 [Bathelium mastoideum]
MGWKDILRPIRDRLDDLLPPGEVDEKERLRKQQQDALKGFKYFESFDELDAWSAEGVDPVQVSNTPILSRWPTRNLYQTATIHLIHDYSGNYHDYESSQGFDVDEEQYSCQYLQFVDTFTYFSHRLVSVPPPAWTNSLHRNGVKSLGTFIVEPGSLHVEKILRTEEVDDQERSPRTYTVATQLTKIAAAYGFDGWLINIEKTFSPHDWDLEKLEGFLMQLRRQMGSTGAVIWYDALNVGNKVSYQNSLTTENLPFLRASGSLLTNYWWTPDKIHETQYILQHEELRSSDVLFGIDVWAQTKQPKDHPRRTWPQDHGGGTRTGLAVFELARVGGAVGIFGPAMPFEHFGKNANAVDRSIWEGLPLPEDLGCDCGDTVQDFHPENVAYPILRHAKQHAAGSRNFFYTNFERAFTKRQRDGAIRAQLGSQSILSIYPFTNSSYRAWPGQDTVQCLDTRVLDDPSRLLIVSKASYGNDDGSDSAKRWSDAQKTQNRVGNRITSKDTRFDLFRLALNCEQSLRVQIKFRPLLQHYPVENDPIVSCFFVTFGDGTTQVLRGRPAEGGAVTVDETIPARSNGRLKYDDDPIYSFNNPNQVIGISVRTDAFNLSLANSTDLLEIYEIRIQSANAAARRYCIRDVHLESRGEGQELRHPRLCWQIREQISKFRECPVERPRLEDGTLDPRPWSSVTGPFSHFKVSVDGEELGRAYALEFVLPDALQDKLDPGEECTVRILGVTFWGEEWESDLVELPDLSREWELI